MERQNLINDVVSYFLVLNLLSKSATPMVSQI